MGKTKWKSIVKNVTKEKTLKRLEIIKQRHSKVKLIKHTKLEMQPYFLPDGLEMTKDITQLIFKLRCRETKVKMNLQGLYDSYQCEICMKEDESQEHIYNCREILKRKENENVEDFEKILHGSVKEQVEVAKAFRDNMEIKEKILSQK